PITKRFRNCLSYERQWQEREGSEDSHGRALWGLGTVLGRSKDAGLRGAAGRLFELAIPAAVEFKSPRACAFAVLGLHEYLDSFPGDRAALGAADELANHLLNSYLAVHSTGWNWFACRLIVLREKAAGGKRRGPPSIGSWETTTCRSLSTITRPADVETVCIRIEPMKTRVRNRHYLF